jgi:hypothetical protein
MAVPVTTMQSAVSAVSVTIPATPAARPGVVDAWLGDLIGLAMAAAVPRAPVGSRVVMLAASWRPACRCVPPGVAGAVNEP